jgi:uridine kinase
MRGEARWITPFVSGADAVFNSALDYEIAVLKPCVETALRIACATGAQTVEALRLLTMIRPFLNLPSDCVPGDSILRETIGNSQLTY